MHNKLFFKPNRLNLSLFQPDTLVEMLGKESFRRWLLDLELENIQILGNMLE